MKLCLIISELLYIILRSTDAVQMQGGESLPRLTVYIVDILKNKTKSIIFNSSLIPLIPDYSGMFGCPCLLLDIVCISLFNHVYLCMIDFPFV